MTRTTAAGPGKAVWTELLSSDPAAAAEFYAAVAGYQPQAIERRGGTLHFSDTRRGQSCRRHAESK